MRQNRTRVEQEINIKKKNYVMKIRKKRIKKNVYKSLQQRGKYI